MNKRWNRNYKLAKAYLKEHGNLLIPANYVVNGIKLGSWIANQRNFYKGYKKHKLSTEQVNKLEEIGMIWDVISYNWNEKYELAKEYYNKHRNLLIPHSYEINNIKIGQWISTQRQAYKHKNEEKFKYRISEEQINKLEEIGMVWDVIEYKWSKNYELVKEYYKEHGNISIPIDYEVNGVKLGKWLLNQKNYYLYGKNHKDYSKIELLENINKNS